MTDRSSRSSDWDSLERGFFEPRSIAVIGASSHPHKVGFALLRNLTSSGYSGGVYPVNPGSDQIQGLKCYPDVGSVPDDIDLAVIVVPARLVPQVVSECAGSGIRCGIVVSAGFRETGIEGRKLEREMLKRAGSGGIRLLGPNCLGIMNTSVPFNASFSRHMPPSGSIGVISQSGAMCASLIDWARSQGTGFSKLVSLGNSADLNESDFLLMLTDDESTSVVSMYLEGVSDGQRFFKSLKSVSARNPVVILKSGTTTAGAKAASSHTGALAGSEMAYTAVCEQAPALRAESVEELVEVSRALSCQQVPRGNRVCIVTNAGGPGIIASDACEKIGMELASLSSTAREALRQGLPAAASTVNPVDLLGDAGARRYADAMETLVDSSDLDALLIILTPQAMTDVDGTAKAIVDIAAGSDKTVLCSFMGGDSVESAVGVLQAAGIPNVSYPDRAVMVLSRMHDRFQGRMKPHSRPIEFEIDGRRIDDVFDRCLEKGEVQVGPEECREVLEACGIKFAPFRIADTFERAVRLAEEIGYPVALKIVSPQILHKTDVGGVVLDIAGPDELEDAFDEILYKVRGRMPNVQIQGVGVQKMAPGGKELILGMVRDPQFGPMVMVGLGGIYVEAFKDISFRMAPVPSAEVALMLRELKAYQLLSGVRGEEPADVQAVEDVLMRVSQLAVEHPRLAEMDINPLMVYNAGDGCICVDVRLTLGGDIS